MSRSAFFLLAQEAAEGGTGSPDDLSAAASVEQAVGVRRVGSPDDLLAAASVETTAGFSDDAQVGSPADLVAAASVGEPLVEGTGPLGVTVDLRPRYGALLDQRARYGVEDDLRPRYGADLRLEPDE